MVDHISDNGLYYISGQALRFLWWEDDPSVQVQTEEVKEMKQVKQFMFPSFESLDWRYYNKVDELGLTLYASSFESNDALSINECVILHHMVF